MGISAVKGLGKIWSDEDATTGEKILSTATSLMMILPLITGAFKLLTIAKNANTIATLANTKGTLKQTAAETSNIAVKGLAKAATLGLATAEALLNAIREHGVVAGLIIGAAAVAAIGTYAALTYSAEEEAKAL
jgi:hypothetical protein